MLSFHQCSGLCSNFIRVNDDEIERRNKIYQYFMKSCQIIIILIFLFCMLLVLWYRWAVRCDLQRLPGRIWRRNSVWKLIANFATIVFRNINNLSLSKSGSLARKRFCKTSNYVKAVWTRESVSSRVN